MLNYRNAIALVVAVTFLAGCGTRSISNSDYSADSDRGYGQRNNPFYKGELNELDVIGIDSKAQISEEEIAKAAASRSRFSIPKGSSIMLIQSGAMIPDEEMVKGMEKYYNVSVFTGIPSGDTTSNSNYSRALRLAAAKGGAEKLIVYWGLLETGREDLATKAISWFPFVGGVITDETQRMRIRMKVAVVDVKSGQWETFSPEPFDDSSSSGRYSRASSDQAQVAALKSKAYKSTADDVVKRYAK
ncbi:MAG: hypothetical protein KIT42_09900 [Rhodocyclaceae bacterium]|nr:hypothetical protein [Rhodocyclaceae bacterium]